MRGETSPSTNGSESGEPRRPVFGQTDRPVIRRKPRSDRQGELVARLLEAADHLSERFMGPELERQLARYMECAHAMNDCSNLLVPAAAGVGVNLNVADYRHAVGAMHCQKAICPICLPYQDAKRAEKLAVRAHAIAEIPLNHFLVTLTLRHHYAPNGNWRVLVDALKAAWRATGKERFFRKAIKAIEAMGGYFWKLENTFSYKNGQHPHFHLLLSLPKSVDAGQFAEKLKHYWETRLKSLGRTCEWQPGWWKALPTSEDLKKTINYLTGGIKEVTGAAAKKLPPWELEPEAFVEIFHSMKGLKWFGSGGCWRTKAVVEAESEENLEAERESKGTLIYLIPRETWNSWSYPKRYEARRIISDRSISHADCIVMLDQMCQRKC